MNNLILELKTNQRLRIGLVLIVAIVWFYGVLELRDRSDAAAQGLTVQARQVFRLQQQSAQSGWLDAARSSGARRAEVEKVLWTTDSPGSANAALQDWLQEKARLAGIPLLQVTFADAVDGGPFGAAVRVDKDDNLPSGISKVKGRMNFDFDGTTFDRFMASVSMGEHPIFVESLTVRNLAPGRADIQFYALARIGITKKVAP